MTADMEKLQAIKKQMLVVIMYSEAWFALKEKRRVLFHKIEKERGIKG